MYHGQHYSCSRHSTQTIHLTFCNSPCTIVRSPASPSIIPGLHTLRRARSEPHWDFWSASWLLPRTPSHTGSWAAKEGHGFRHHFSAEPALRSNFIGNLTPAVLDLMEGLNIERIHSAFKRQYRRPALRATKYGKNCITQGGVKYAPLSPCSLMISRARAGRARV